MGKPAHILLHQSVAVIATVLGMLSPATARAHIYKWVDERGMTIYSNVLPEKSDPKNVEVVIEEEKASGSEQRLLERIGNLERQLQAQQYQGQMPPPPSPGYGSYSPGYSPSYYPNYYPSYYSSYPLTYPYVVLSRRFIGHARTFVSPRFAPARVASFHHGGVSRGRR
jgi:hypothetical protein